MQSAQEGSIIEFQTAVSLNGEALVYSIQLIAIDEL